MGNWGTVLLLGEPPQPSRAALSTRGGVCSSVCTPAGLGASCSLPPCMDKRWMVLPHWLPSHISS